MREHSGGNREVAPGNQQATIEIKVESRKQSFGRRKRSIVESDLTPHDNPEERKKEAALLVENPSHRHLSRRKQVERFDKFIQAREEREPSPDTVNQGVQTTDLVEEELFKQLREWKAQNPTKLRNFRLGTGISLASGVQVAPQPTATSNFVVLQSVPPPERRHFSPVRSRP